MGGGVDGWQELHASSVKTIRTACNERGLCPAVNQADDGDNLQ